MTNSPLSRRSFLRLAGMAAAGTALEACFSYPLKSPRQSGEKVQLVYQDWRTEWFPVMAQDALRDFHATHPNIPFIGRFFHGGGSRQHSPPRNEFQGYKTAPDQSGWADLSPIYGVSFCSPATSSPVGAATGKKPTHVSPNIRVFYTPDPTDLAESMMAAMQAGTAPDVFAGCCIFFPIWAQEGYTLDLCPYVEADLDQATLDDWDPAQYQSFFTRGGQPYALPKYQGALALFYNKHLLYHYNMDYPDETWDHGDYLSAMRRLTHDRDRDGATDPPAASRPRSLPTWTKQADLLRLHGIKCLPWARRRWSR
jgi:hypothetical protein